jgi:hypothetical protein
MKKKLNRKRAREVSQHDAKNESDYFFNAAVDFSYHEDDDLISGFTIDFVGMSHKTITERKQMFAKIEKLIEEYWDNPGGSRGMFYLNDKQRAKTCLKFFDKIHTKIKKKEDKSTSLFKTDKMPESVINITSNDYLKFKP